MRSHAQSHVHRSLARWKRSHGLALRFAGCFLSVFLATTFVGLSPEDNLIWVANGVLLAYLLLAPRKRWPFYLCAGYSAQCIGGLLVGHHGVDSALLLTLLNVGESLVSALFLRRRSSQLPDFTNPVYLARFLAFGVFAGPIIMGAAATMLSPLWHQSSPGTEFLQWVSSDALGACVATPACIAIFRARFRKSLYSIKNWAHLAPIAVCAATVFSQSRLPLPFLLYPLLVMVLLRLGLGWAAMASLLVAAVGSSFTVRGQGPFAVSYSTTPLESAILLQLFIASAMVILYSVSVVIESLRVTERRLQEIAALHKLVTDNSRDVIILADFKCNRSYCSAAAKNYGYTAEEFTRQKSLDLVHPEDLGIAQAALESLRSGAEGAIVECRLRKRTGEYTWVEESLRLVRDPVTNVPTGILNMARDITERKLAEKQLQEAYRAVEVLAVTDALTGLANRRQFDQSLAMEWRRGVRNHSQLSLLLVDVDWFKSYNDKYGHLRGDSCLRQIAEAAQCVVTRSGDLVTRFGGEEFAVILPETPSDGAIEVANAICESLRTRKLPHEGNPFGSVTVSVGCATATPQLGQDSASLVELADQALYKAKRSGRNQVCASATEACQQEKVKSIFVESATAHKAS